MTTIEEMALKAYPINMLGDGDCSLDLAKIPRRAYIEGAKAVLEEIEKAYNTFKNPGATCAIVNKVIKELKG